MFRFACLHRVSPRILAPDPECSTMSEDEQCWSAEFNREIGVIIRHQCQNPVTTFHLHRLAGCAE